MTDKEKIFAGRYTTEQLAEAGRKAKKTMELIDNLLAELKRVSDKDFDKFADKFADRLMQIREE